jgi:Ni2+-binding GTPase involved in maturation of urease and hydrogenase
MTIASDAGKLCLTRRTGGSHLESLRHFEKASISNGKIMTATSLSSTAQPATIRFIMLGGFLGAGKTTTIGRLARHYQERGLKVGIVTNDQATDLVDTQSLRAQGFEVGEVPGSCFCCNFNALTKTVAELSADQRPDVILAEPVGSCTDLVATVVRPLQQLFAATFEVAPYGVLLKPSHGGRILRNEARAGFSPQAAYIFRKQLEEADFIVVNRIDQLSASEIAELTGLLERDFPGVPVLRLSAKTGDGFAAFVEMIDQRGHFGGRRMEVDYDVYAAGEAELGWLNSSLKITAAEPFALDDLLLEIVKTLQHSLAELACETAHLKTIGLAEGAYAVANLISSFSPPELSLASQAKVREAQIIVNARVAMLPEALQQQVTAALEAVCGKFRANLELQQTQSFQPGRPVPTHRIMEPTT